MSNIPADFNEPLYPISTPKQNLEDTNLYPDILRTEKILTDKDKVSDSVTRIPINNIDNSNLDYNVVPIINNLDNEPILYGKPTDKKKLDGSSVY
jgi:hypothetical protein